MSTLPLPRALPQPGEPCAWCGWLRGEHATACPLHAFTRGDANTLAWPPGRNEPGYRPPNAAAHGHVESAAKLDCPE